MKNLGFVWRRLRSQIWWGSWSCSFGCMWVFVYYKKPKVVNILIWSKKKQRKILDFSKESEFHISKHSKLLVFSGKTEIRKWAHFGSSTQLISPEATNFFSWKKKKQKKNSDFKAAYYFLSCLWWLRKWKYISVLCVVQRSCAKKTDIMLEKNYLCRSIEMIVAQS